MGGFDHHRTHRLEPRYFNVTIAGGVDHFTPQDHVAENPGVNLFPTTKVASLTKEYAHARWEYIAKMLGERHVPVVTKLAGTGRTNDAPATSFTFTVMYDREGYVITNDELNGNRPMGPAEAFNPLWVAGTQYTLATEAEVVERYISRVLIATWQETRQIYDPTAGYIGTTPIDTAHPGDIIERITVPAAQANIPAANGVVTTTLVV